MTWATKVFGVQREIIEVEAPKPQVSSPELEESIKSLAAHPGFAALLNRLRLQRSQLESKLRTDFDAKLDNLRFLQSGIFWTGWLERQLNRQVYKAEAPRGQTPLQEEQAAFEAIHKTLQAVGM